MTPNSNNWNILRMPHWYHAAQLLFKLDTPTEGEFRAAESVNVTYIRRRQMKRCSAQILHACVYNEACRVTFLNTPEIKEMFVAESRPDKSLCRTKRADTEESCALN